MHRFVLVAAILANAVPSDSKTVVGIRVPNFTINGNITYTEAAGFPHAEPNLAGTLLNVRAVQAIFDDANYPRQGSRSNPYPTQAMGPVWFDYPDGKWDPERNVKEFLAALPLWRRCGLLAFTVNLQGGGPTDGNYGVHNAVQPHDNNGFDAQGNLKPAYADRLKRVIAKADELGMVVIVGLFYQGENARIADDLEDGNARRAIEQAMQFLRALPHRNMLVEINNEVGVGGYVHRLLKPDGIAEAIEFAQRAGGRAIPVSASWVGGVRGERALRAADFILFHTNGRTPEQVHDDIQAMRRAGGNDKPALINEDGVSTFNLRAAVQEHVGWGYYDQGWNDYVHGFQSPPVNWSISTPVKWLFFEQVARLTGSPVPPRPVYSSSDTPVIHVEGLAAGQALRGPVRVEAIVEDRHPRWPIKRVEFFVDGIPYSYSTRAPYLLGGSEAWSADALAAGPHILRVAAFDRRGPSFSEACAVQETPFVVRR